MIDEDLNIKTYTNHQPLQHHQQQQHQQQQQQQ